MGPPADLTLAAGRLERCVVSFAVRPRAERQTATAQYHHPGVKVALQGLEHVTDLGHHAGVDRVAATGSVQPDVQHLGPAGVTFQGQGLIIGHGGMVGDALPHRPPVSVSGWLTPIWYLLNTPMRWSRHSRGANGRRVATTGAGDARAD